MFSLQDQTTFLHFISKTGTSRLVLPPPVPELPMHSVTANSFLSIPHCSRHGKPHNLPAFAQTFSTEKIMLSWVGFVLSLNQQEVTPEQREKCSFLGSSGVAAPGMLRMGAASALGTARRRISLGADGLSKCKQILSMPINWGTGGFFDKNKKKKKRQVMKYLLQAWRNGSCLGKLL